jgi:hypothetical protein
MNNALMDSGRIMFFHFPLGSQRRAGVFKDFFWKGQDLKKLTIKGNEVVFDQRVSCQNVLIDRNPKESADFIIAIEGHAASIPYDDQKKIEQKFMVIETGKEAIT